MDRTERLAAVHRGRSPLIVGLAAAGSLGLIALVAVGIVLARNGEPRSVSVEPVATSRTTVPVPTASDYPSTSSSPYSSYTPEPTPTYSSSSDYSDSSDYSTSSSTPTYGPYDGDYYTSSATPTPEPSYSSAPTSGETLTVHEGGGDLNVRVTPSTSATSIAIVPDGGTFTYSCYTTGEYVVGSVATSDTWLYVSTPGGDGYISAAFAEVEPDHEFGPRC